MRKVRDPKKYKGIRTRFRTAFKPGMKYSTQFRQSYTGAVYLLVKIKENEILRPLVKKSLSEALGGWYEFEGHPIKLVFQEPAIIDLPKLEDPNPGHPLIMILQIIKWFDSPMDALHRTKTLNVPRFMFHGGIDGSVDMKREVDLLLQAVTKGMVRVRSLPEEADYIWEKRVHRWESYYEPTIELAHKTRDEYWRFLAKKWGWKA